MSRVPRKPCPGAAGQRIHTARDLLLAAGARSQPIPVLLAVTILVETLNALAAGRRRGARKPLTVDRILLNGAPPEALLDDPTRDPKVELSGVASRGEMPGVQHAGAVFFELLSGSPPSSERPFSTPERTDLPAAAEPLLRGLLAPRAAERLDIAEALSAARAIGIELFDSWDRQRRRTRLENDLRDALERRCEPRTRELADALAELAPRSEWLRRSRMRLDVRSRKAQQLVAARHRLTAALHAGPRRDVELRGAQLQHLLGPESEHDPDLTLSRQWLREQDDRRARRRREARRVSLKLLLTGAPLIFATFLTGLLAVVMFFSG